MSHSTLSQSELINIFRVFHWLWRMQALALLFKSKTISLLTAPFNTINSFKKNFAKDLDHD